MGVRRKQDEKRRNLLNLLLSYLVYCRIGDRVFYVKHVQPKPRKLLQIILDPSGKYDAVYKLKEFELEQLKGERTIRMVVGASYEHMDDGPDLREKILSGRIGGVSLSPEELELVRAPQPTGRMFEIVMDYRDDGQKGEDHESA